MPFAATVSLELYTSWLSEPYLGTKTELQPSAMPEVLSIMVGPDEKGGEREMLGQCCAPLGMLFAAPGSLLL